MVDFPDNTPGFDCGSRPLRARAIPRFRYAELARRVFRCGKVFHAIAGKSLRDRKTLPEIEWRLRYARRGWPLWHKGAGARLTAAGQGMTVARDQRGSGGGAANRLISVALSPASWRAA